MQGTLNEIDIRSILQLIALGQRTGELFVEAYPPSLYSRLNLLNSFESENLYPHSRLALFQNARPIWFVFFVNGQIAYAADNNANNNLQRLQDYLHRYKLKEELNRLKDPTLATVNAPEYAYLWQLLEHHIITPEQGRSIIQNMIEETLFDLFSLHQGKFIFEISCALAPQLMTLEINPLILKIGKQVQQWKQFHPQIQFPSQCPIITDENKLKTSLEEGAFKSIYRWVDGKTTLRQLARYFNRDLATIARAVYPYIKRGWIQLTNPLNSPIPSSNKVQSGETVPPRVFKLVCIDDDLTIGKSVEYILAPQGYEITILNNPLESLKQVFTIKPDLILCDIAMPELDGYEICSMLRHSNTFKQTPIIMLTGKDGFIDRIRAKMVGATDYLTKPFGKHELLMLVEKHLGAGVNPHQDLESTNENTNPPAVNE
jgi:twitching motility two-component system response regulator PilG